MLLQWPYTVNNVNKNYYAIITLLFIEVILIAVIIRDIFIWKHTSDVKLCLRGEHIHNNSRESL